MECAHHLQTSAASKDDMESWTGKKEEKAKCNWSIVGAAAAKENKRVVIDIGWVEGD